MRRLRWLIILAGLCASCATVPTSDGGVSPTTAYGHCATQALTQAAEGILGDVTTALATGNYESAIAALAIQVGGAEVGCAVDLLMAQFTTKAARTDDAFVGTVLAHAQAWRQEHP